MVPEKATTRDRPKSLAEAGSWTSRVQALFDQGCDAAELRRAFIEQSQPEDYLLMEPSIEIRGYYHERFCASISEDTVDTPSGRWWLNWRNGTVDPTPQLVQKAERSRALSEAEADRIEAAFDARIAEHLGA
jgi:hypothetical protein